VLPSQQANIQYTVLPPHDRIVSAVKMVEFVSDSISDIILRSHWCDTIVPNFHAPTEDKIDEVKNSFYKELGSIFNKFPKYHMKVLLGQCNVECTYAIHGRDIRIETTRKTKT
jgi:hypothetical protein